MYPTEFPDFDLWVEDYPTWLLLFAASLPTGTDVSA